MIRHPAPLLKQHLLRLVQEFIHQFKLFKVKEMPRDTVDIMPQVLLS